ncbi:hypothetical protein [Clostridium saccharobutylicum]|uniref:Uncharacterized protein n=1 Tax=Clostridium saccharobutylicum TaxID=169679 RepID=A0A1S8NB96_CLOSA|nr:hypothetical protein [Clostridium saccharobutylicum]OOM13756.1 hypothetical protein CLOSAC_18420 [Clostridium saccharobutylicum]
MEKVNNLMSEAPLHLTTNTIILASITIFAFYILLKAISSMIKIVAVIGIFYFVLMSLQSTNLVNIPAVKETYTTIEKIIPSKELWTDALDKADKINKVVNDLK